MSLSMHIFNIDEQPVNQDMSSLISALGDEDGLARQKARETLVNYDGLAVPVLISTLSGGPRDARWEAAKALSEIGDPAAAPALVEALQDERFGVRWLAAEGLIALGKNAVLVPLMKKLSESADSVWLRQGAHHVLRALAREGLPETVGPVLTALEDVEPAIEVPPRARRAWQSLTGGEPGLS